MFKLTYKVQINLVIEWNEFWDSSWHKAIDRLCKAFLNRCECLNGMIIIHFLKKGTYLSEVGAYAPHVPYQVHHWYISI